MLLGNEGTVDTAITGEHDKEAIASLNIEAYLWGLNNKVLSLSELK